METVTRTREAPFVRLVGEAAARLAGMLAAGTTTVESKSGYGLATHTELDLLRVNGVLDERSPVDVVSTFLGAHGFAPEVSRERYIDIVCEEMTPLVADEGLATFCDVWTDNGYYDKEESRRVLEAGRAHGLEPKIHADAYSYVGGTDLAAEMRVVSADHLNFTPPDVMRKMAKAGVVGVVMPALDFAVRHPRPFEARALIEAGMTLALATDLCPGCWAESQQFVMALACRLYGMSPSEALWAATAGGAAALSLDDRGVLAPGRLADVQVWDVPQYEHAVYRLGGSVVERVYKRGRLVTGGGRPADDDPHGRPHAR
jgi:imidazolonepropionase